jgi:hypothetical protein
MRPSFLENPAPVIVGEYVTSVSNMQYVAGKTLAIFEQARRDEGGPGRVFPARRRTDVRDHGVPTDTHDIS